MNILFNALQCGIGNNGGSKTIIRSAETLQDMGHNVVIWSQVNNYTWHIPKVKILSSYRMIGYPDNSQEIIVSSWELEAAYKRRLNYNAIWYCRGWETWVRGEEWLIDQSKQFINSGGRIIVNSSWLIDQFKNKCGVDVELCHAGLDLNEWEGRERTHKEPYTIGGMIYERHQSKRSDMLFNLDVRNKLNKRFVNIKSGYSNNKLCNVYNECDIWLSPTELEGFHNVAAEANLCGCLVVCNRMPSNGMGDYSTDETAMRYTGHDELLACLNNPDFSKVPKMQKILREKIGSREKNMKRFVELIS